MHYELTIRIGARRRKILFSNVHSVPEMLTRLAKWCEEQIRTDEFELIAYRKKFVEIVEL